MGTPPINNVIPRAIALGTAALGLRMFQDRWGHMKGGTQAHINEVVEDDFINHNRHSIPSYSGYDTLTSLNHWIFNPANFHFIKLPYIWATSVKNVLLENMIPIALTTVGLTWGFGQPLIGDAATPGVLRRAVSGIRAVGGPVCNGLGTAAQTMWNLASTRILSLRMPNINLGPRGIGALVMGGAMAMYVAHLFKRELTGENRQDFANFLNPPGH